MSIDLTPPGPSTVVCFTQLITWTGSIIMLSSLQNNTVEQCGLCWYWVQHRPRVWYARGPRLLLPV